VVKLALKWRKSEAEAEREVREYLVKEGVVKETEVVEVEMKVVMKKRVTGRRKEKRGYRTPAGFTSFKSVALILLRSLN
jgi:hypothetical protein